MLVIFAFYLDFTRFICTTTQVNIIKDSMSLSAIALRCYNSSSILFIKNFIDSLVFFQESYFLTHFLEVSYSTTTTARSNPVEIFSTSSRLEEKEKITIIILFTKIHQQLTTVYYQLPLYLLNV